MRKTILTLIALTLAVLAASPAMAQSFSGFLRGLSNSLGGGSNQPAPAQNTSATATIGIRGMDDETASTGPARPEDLKLLDSWSATQAGAEAAARKRGLSANPAVVYEGASTTAAAPTTEAEQ